jgi:iron complex outermembrane receptor protein
MLYEKADGTPIDNAGQAKLFPLGSPQPTATLGWTNNFSLGNFDLTFFFRGAFGQKVFNASSMIYGIPTTFPSTNVLQKTFQGDNASITNTGPAYSSLHIENASFLRLDNVNLGYKLPLQLEWLRSLRVYAAGQNLLLFTGYSGMDPEVRSGASRGVYDNSFDAGQNLSFGLDDTVFYPLTRTFTIGLSAIF